MKPVTEMLSGWGNYPTEPGHVYYPANAKELRALVTDAPELGLIARGLGRSYGDSALNRDAGILAQTQLNRCLSFDDAGGVLECLAGVSLAEIIQHFLPRGWFLPTTPGTKYVTLGGAIAADVHGKNHHADGSFAEFVRDLQLLTASGELLRCSPTENPDVFWATIGGMGLTGVIVYARVQLHRVETPFLNVTYRRTKNLDDTLSCFAETNHRYRHSVAWVDCLARGAVMGRSVVMLANEARADELPPHLRGRALRSKPEFPLAVPPWFPSYLLNPLSVKLFNQWYFRGHPDGCRLVDYESFFYPLDGIKNWNRLYGRRGFIQYQALFPPHTSRQGLIELLEKITASRRASFLVVLKSTGRASNGMLSYPFPGHTLALDFPHPDADLLRLIAELDEILLKYSGRLYLAKDATMTAETFAVMYPRLEEFRQVKRRIDPENRFVSSQARRLKIVDTPSTQY